MTLERMQPVQDELIMFLTLNGFVGVFLVISVGVDLVQQIRAKSDNEKLTITTDYNQNDYISISCNETDVWPRTISKIQNVWTVCCNCLTNNWNILYISVSMFYFWSVPFTLFPFTWIYTININTLILATFWIVYWGLIVPEWPAATAICGMMFSQITEFSFASNSSFVVVVFFLGGGTNIFEPRLFTNLKSSTQKFRQKD